VQPLSRQIGLHMSCGVYTNALITSLTCTSWKVTCEKEHTWLTLWQHSTRNYLTAYHSTACNVQPSCYPAQRVHQPTQTQTHNNNVKVPNATVDTNNTNPAWVAMAQRSPTHKCWKPTPITLKTTGMKTNIMICHSNKQSRQTSNTNAQTLAKSYKQPA